MVTKIKVSTIAQRNKPKLIKEKNLKVAGWIFTLSPAAEFNTSEIIQIIAERRTILLLYRISRL